MVTDRWTAAAAVPFADALARAHRPLLADVARAHFASEGRGFVSVIWRGGPPIEVPTIAELRIGYWPAARYQEKTAGHTGPIRQMADHVLSLVTSYRSEAEFVLVAVVGPQFLTVPYTVPLVAPVILDEAEGVH